MFRATKNYQKLVAVFLVASCTSAIGQLPIDDAEGQWPMASGPHGTWLTNTQAPVPVFWSGSRNENILWKTILPEGGQSGIAVWGERLFFTINKPLPIGTTLEDAKGSDIIGYCVDSDTGKVLWTIDIPSPKSMPYSGLFSDNTSATPITDGKHVWFINHGGLIICCNVDGKEVWRKSFESRTRHNAKQCEPILVDGQLLFVMMRESDDPLRRPMKAEAGIRNTPAEHWPWTFVRAFEASTGNTLWTESSGTSVHNTPRLGYVAGEAFLFHARGGGHQPPEKPYGFSLSHASGRKAGTELWSHHSSRVVAYTVSHFDEDHSYGFDGDDVIKLDTRSGKVIAAYSVFEKADIRLWNESTQTHELQEDAPFSKVVEKFKKEPSNQTPILVGKYFLFLSHEGHCIGRLNTETGKTEFFQVPIQAVREPGKEDNMLWSRPIPSDGRNSRGIKTANDKRSEGDGWGHVTSGSPIAVNEFVYFSTMIGMTYVVNTQQEVFDESALIAINDLGPAGSTWSLSSPSYAAGKLFPSRTEVHCLYRS